MKENLKKFEPLFEREKFSEKEKYYIKPFFSNLDESVYVPYIFSPELIGSLCSRTSRARDDLRRIFLEEFLSPFKNNFKYYLEFLHKNPYEKLFFNPKAREFYIKWLAQYGDDSIAQMAGCHLVFSSLSQVAIKFLENQRIGLAPIEKSTRFIDFSSKIKGSYRYYTDPNIKKMGLQKEYKSAMDNLFETYIYLSQKLTEILKEKYKEESNIAIRTKVFDIIRGILPCSTLSQVSFFGNGQAFEYMIARCKKHPLGEIRWVAYASFRELKKIIPAFLRRLVKKESIEYQKYLAKKEKNTKFILKKLKEDNLLKEKSQKNVKVKIVEYDKFGEEKIIAGLIYQVSHKPWEYILKKVKKMTSSQKEKILKSVLKDRKFRWYKVPRAFENAYVRFEIVMNIGAWRDLQRHRMLTHQNQKFTIIHGYDVPEELNYFNLKNPFTEAIKKAESIFLKIKKYDEYIAQYATTLAHRIRFMQYQNLRSFFWETELRTISQGHIDYRVIEQEKYKQLKKIYPLISKFVMVDLKKYYFPRREISKKITQKEKELKKIT